MVSTRFRIGINHFWKRMINGTPVCDDYDIGSALRDAATRACWRYALANLLHHFIGYMALFDRDAGFPRQIITASEAMSCASYSDHSEGAGLDSVTKHQPLVTIAPLDEFTNVQTVSGDIPRRRQAWRTSVELAGQPERRPPGCRNDNPVCFVYCATPTPRV